MEGGGLDMLKGDGGGRCVCRCRFDGGKCGYGIGGGWYEGYGRCCVRGCW